MLDSLKQYAGAIYHRISDHHDLQLAASISYYALLALFPTAIVITAIAALFIDDPAVKEDIVDYLFDQLPVSETDGRGDLEQLVNSVTSDAATIGIVGLAGMLVSASALMTALRNSTAIAFEIEDQRSFLRGKAIDIALVIGVGLLLLVSVGGTLAINLLDATKDDLGTAGDAIGGVSGFLTGLLPIAITALIFTVLLTVVPVRRVSWSQVWPAVALGTVCFELLKRLFSLYLDSFGNYSAVYGSLGAIVAFMVFIYLSAIVLLGAAELAAIRVKEAAGDEELLDARPPSPS